MIFVAIFAVCIRFNNLQNYSTVWADDGGAHMQYVEIVLREHVLPTMDQTYLAWHEPLYYVVNAVWIQWGEWLGFQGLNLWETLNFVIGLLFLVVVGWFTYVFSKDKWLALLNVFLFTVFFQSVKLSAFVNNELLAQTLIVLLVGLFIFWKLFELGKIKQVVLWSVILGLALLAKLTVVIVFIAVGILWLGYALIKKKPHTIKYLILCAVIVGAINTPWLIYKQQNFGHAFSTNIYEQNTKQSLLTSDAWDYIFEIDLAFIKTYPYWHGKIIPVSYSFAGIFIADSFSDYYNLFTNADAVENLADEQKQIVGNGRAVNLENWNNMLWMNRLGLLFVMIWLAGLLVLFWRLIFAQKFKQKNNWYEYFVILILIGGWLALLYNNLRHPYLERGVLKTSFILFTFPIWTTLAYQGWHKIIKKKTLLFSLMLVLIVIYAVIAWPVIFV